MQKKLGLIAQLLPKIGFKHFTAAYRGSPPPAVFHNQIKKNTAGKSASIVPHCSCIYCILYYFCSALQWVQNIVECPFS